MYGTVSQTAVMVSRSENCAFYAYRETARPADGDAPAGELGAWQWQRVPLPAAAEAAVAADEK